MTKSPAPAQSIRSLSPQILSPAALRPGIQKTFRLSLSPLSFGLSALFAVLAVADALLLPDGANVKLSLSALCIALAFLGTRILLGRKVVPSEYANLVGGAMALLAFVYCLERIFLLNTPFYPPSLIIFILTCGYIFLSSFWLGLILPLAFAGWFFTAISLGASISDLTVPALELLVIVTISVLIHIVHLRTVERLERYRLRSRHRKNDLEQALTAKEEARQAAETSRKESEAAIRDLRQSQERFKRLAEATFEGIVIHDKGRIRDINSALVEMTGYDAEELLRGNILSLIEANARDFFQKNLETRGTIPFESTVLRKDGEILPVEICNRPLPFMGRTIQVAAIRDTNERIKAERALRTSEAKNRALLNAIPDLMFRIDTGGVIRDYKADTNNLLLENSKSLLNRNIYEVLPKELARLILIKIRKTLRRGKRQTLEFQHEIRGKTRDYEARFFMSGENETLVIVRDMTETKSSKKKVYENELLYRQMFEENHAIQLLIDPESSEIVEANSAACNFYGYSLEELKSKKISEINTLPVEEVRKEIQRVLTGENNYFTFKHRLADGEERYVEVFAGPINVNERTLIYSIVHDVTDRHKAENRLRLSEERYRRFFEEDLTADFISTPDGRLLDCNPAFVRIFGFSSREEALQCDLPSLYPDPKDRVLILADLQKYGKLEGEEVEFRGAAGNQIHVIENVSGVFNDGGELVELRGYIFDITERKTLEAQLLHSQKMEAVGRLAGGVAHDFNNLLTAITGYSQLMLDKLNDPETLRNDIDEIKKACDLGASLTTQLLTFSRKHVTQPEILDLNAVIGELKKLLKRLVGENIELVIAKHEKPCTLKADIGQIKQVIMNLALNSLDAMPDGGVLTIRASVKAITRGEEDIFADSVQTGRYISLEVEDTGQGMNFDVRSHIFEPFFTTKSEGTGLGLSTVYGIVKQNDGFIDVSSVPDAGTRISILFPNVRAERKETAPKKHARAINPGCGTILLVEDEDAVRQVASLVLSRNGYKVIAADNGMEALKKSRQHAAEIDLMVSDMVMPGMNGRELAEKIIAERPSLRILFMSGYVADENMNADHKTHNYIFLQKPFSPETLLLKVQQSFDADAEMIPA